MQQRRLGNSGLYVSEIGIGCNNFGMRVDQAGTNAVVSAALDQGIDFFDTADVYGERRSEVFLGKALGARRGEVVIATKFGIPTGAGQRAKGGSRGYIMRAVEASLERLGTDYIDVYQIHLPDAATPIEETLGALSDCVRDGKVRYIGCSNFDGWQIADADWTARSHGFERFVSAQNHLNLLNRGALKEVMPACRRFGLGQLPYFPLASGLLTGKYRRGEPAPEGTRLANPRGASALNDKNFDVVQKLAAFAEERGRTLLELAFGWLLSLEEVTSVIAGATRVEQVASNVESSTLRLDADEMKAIDGLLAD